MSTSTGEASCAAYRSSNPSTVTVYSVCVCVVLEEEEDVSVFWESNEGGVEYKSIGVTDKALFSLTTTTAAIPALDHLSQRANEEDSGPTHICFRSKAICCKCVRCDGRQVCVCEE